MCSRSHSWRLHRSGVTLRSCSMRLMLLLDAVAQPTSNISQAVGLICKLHGRPQLL